MQSASYISTLSAFTRFLAAYIHTLLYLRKLYPRASFIRARAYNAPVYQSRHPLVCEWVRDALTAVHHQVLSGSVARIAIVVYHYDPATTKGARTATIMERYMVDVSALPVVDMDEGNPFMEWNSPHLLHSSPEDDNDDNHHDEDGHEDVDGDGDIDDDDNLGGGDPHVHDASEEDFNEDQHEPENMPEEQLYVDLTEQFRSALIALTTRCAQLRPLPPKCSFNISMELKDEAYAHPPLAHPQSWVPVPPAVQHKTPNNIAATGQDSGNKSVAKILPVRTMEAGVFQFETWIEEGNARFCGDPRTSKA